MPALLQQSYCAYCNDLSGRSNHQRKADALNGMVVSDSDTDDPEQYVGISLGSERISDQTSKIDQEKKSLFVAQVIS